MRNESELGSLVGPRRCAAVSDVTVWGLPQHRPFRIFLKDMSKSTYAGTRKSANYGWLG